MGWNFNFYTMKKRFLKFCYFLLVGVLFASQVYSQKYEAESATLTNGATKIDCSTCSEGAAVAQKDGNLSFKVDVEEEGFYNIYLNAAAPGGEKANTMRIGELSADFHLEESQYVRLKVVSTLKRSAGQHEIEIIKSWGWINIDYIELEKVDASNRFDLNQTLVSPDPIPEVVALYGFLLDHYGKRIVSGVMTLDSLDEAMWLKEKTGKEPALLGIDFMHSGRGYDWYNDKMPVVNARTWYERNGIPALMWHWRDPSRTTEEFYSKFTDFDVLKISDETSEEYKAIIADIDYVAGLLTELQADNIPVVWRPLHEAAGGWFWWGAKGPEPLKELWRLVFDRMVNHHGLNNLIWVWTSEPGDEEWYPGDEYVDIVGRDIYKDGDHSSQVLEFNALNDQFGGKKMITLSEVGSFPNVDNLMKDEAEWSWYMPWYGGHTRDSKHNSLDLWKTMFAHEYVITLDEMPVLSTYERHEVEELVIEPDPEPQPTGIFREVEKKTFKAYPTWIENSLTIQSEKKIETISVYNLLGSFIKQQKGSGYEETISFSGVHSGIYLVRVNGLEAIRVLKQ